jgi:peptidoglycan/xylan/chitin deacetylase (PgdA/CDA1 family)
MNFRLDRLATLYLASPCLRLAAERAPSIPILMYHSITSSKPSNIHPYYCTTTSPAVFAQQLKHLRDHGYTACPVAEAVRRLKEKRRPFAKSVVLTFDDGFRNFHREAFPLLKQYGFSATVFLPTAFIGETPQTFKGEACLTWAEVRELNRQGIEFGSHTVNHPWLRELSISAIRDEVVNSKDTIEQKLGCPTDSFAYPYAFPQPDRDFTKMLRGLLCSAGYETGVCTIVGRANGYSDSLFLERLPVNSCDDELLFGAKLAGAYDWVGVSQHLVKALKSRFHGTHRRTKLRVSNDFPWRTQPHP